MNTLRFFIIVGIAHLVASCSGKSSTFKGPSSESHPVTKEMLEAKAKEKLPIIIEQGNYIELEGVPFTTKTKINVTWKLKSEIPGLASYYIRILSSDGKTILTEQNVSLEQAKAVDGHIVIAIDKDFDEGLYRAQVVAWGADFAQLDVATGSAMVDRSGPAVKLYLGSNNSGNVCEKAPEQRSVVGTRVSPFEYCANDALVGVSSLCILPSTSAAPAAADACFKKQADFDLNRVSLLKNGANDFTLYALDALGNMGQGSATVRLEPGRPPRVDIFAPLNKEIAGVRWQPETIKHLEWRVTDNDTPPEKTRSFITLVDEDDPSHFEHIACSFKDPTGVVCPTGAAQIPDSFKYDKAANKFSFDLKIPADWSVNKHYNILFMAMDEGGNTGLASTQGVNRDYETVAGRSYKGIGGSGQTIDRAASNYNSEYLVLNKSAELIDTSKRFKIRSFDGRSCRVILFASEKPEAFDCQDAIKSPYTTISPAWAYSASKDVFYAVAALNGINILAEINFAKNSTRTLMATSGASLTPLSKATLNAKMSEVSFGTALYTAYYQEKMGALFFRSGGAIYKANMNDETVSYVAGQEAANYADIPADIQKGKASEIAFPFGNFLVLDSGTIFMAGAKLLADDFGGSRGTQWLLTGLDFSNPNAEVTLARLKAAVADSNDDYMFRTQATYPFYSESRKSIIAGLAWFGILELPVTGDKTVGTWKPLAGVAGGPTEEDVFDADTRTLKINAGEVFKFDHSAGGLAPVLSSGGTAFYANNRTGGNILFYDLSSNSVEVVVGSLVGKESGNLATNTFLADPGFLSLDALGRLLLGDTKNLYRVNAGNLEIVKKGYVDAPFQVNGNKIITLDGYTNITTFDLTTGPTGPTTRVGGANVENNPGSYYVRPVMNTNGYEVIYTLGNTSNANFKTYNITTRWDGVRGFPFMGIATLNSIGSVMTTPTVSTQKVSVTDEFTFGDARFKDCGGALCTQGVGSPAIPANQFRIPANSSRYLWNIINLGAFDSTENFVYMCLDGNFYRYSVSANAYTKFNGVLADGTAVVCPIRFNRGGGVFHASKADGGNIYFGDRSVIYKITDVSQLASAGKVVFAPVAAGRIPANCDIRDLFVSATDVYYSCRIGSVYRSPLN